MFGKNDFVDDLSRDLCRARDKRDALASHVTTLTAQITELEARLSAENDRRERERAVGEIEGIKKQLTDHYLVFAPAIAGMRDRLNPRGQSFRRLPTSITRSCWLQLKSPTQSMPCWPIWTGGWRPCGPATLHRNCHSPSVDLKSWRKIMIAYSVFQNGCLAGS